MGWKHDYGTKSCFPERPSTEVVPPPLKKTKQKKKTFPVRGQDMLNANEFT